MSRAPTCEGDRASFVEEAVLRLDLEIVPGTKGGEDEREEGCWKKEQDQLRWCILVGPGLGRQEDCHEISGWIGHTHNRPDLAIE